MGALTLTMPWPSLKPLSPNWRGHWGAKAKAKKIFRRVWWAEALNQGAIKLDAERVDVHLTFHPPGRYHYDEDNLIASLKSGLDGLADALGVNDSKFHITHDPVSDQIGGFVRVNLKWTSNAI